MRSARTPVITQTLAVVALLLAAPAVIRAQPAEAPPVAERPAHGRSHLSAGDSGFLGVSVRPLNIDLRRHFGAPPERGVLVATVDPGTPAADAGLAVGDVLVAVDGREIASVAALHRAVRGHAGEAVQIEVYRDGRPLTLEATLGERPRPRRHLHGEHHDDEWAEHWADWAEGWAEWGEEWGEGFAEWGEEFGEHWAGFGAEMAERWGERGADWGELGAEIGERMGEAFADMDWDEMDRALAESLRALEEIDWDEIGNEIDRAMEEVDAALEKALDEIEKDREGPSR